MRRFQSGASAARLGLFAGLVLTFSSACTFEPQLGSPAGISSPTEFSSRQVRFEVLCQGCTVVYAAGRRTGDAEAEGGWSKSVSVNAREVPEVSLYVNPAFEGAAIHRARILVEGRIVAEAEGGRGRGLADPIRLTARISEAPDPHRP